MLVMRYALAIAAVAAAPILAGAQSGPRTPWGDPDLQGVWPIGQLNTVPFERPVALGTRALLNDKEFAQLELEMKRLAEANAAEFSPGGGGGVNPPSHWLEAGRPSRQASLIVDPLDGRLPPMTDEGKRQIGRAHV